MFIYLIAGLIGSVSCTTYDILAVLPHGGRSHFLAFEPLLEALAERGHRLTVASPFGEGGNWSHVPLSKPSEPGLQVDSVAGLGPIDDFLTISQIGLATCDVGLSSPRLHDLLRSKPTFHLILIELFTTDCFLGLVQLLDAPFLALSSTSIFPTTGDRFGNPENPSYIPNMFLPYSDRMSFGERSKNAFTSFLMGLYKRYYLEPEAHRIAVSRLGADIRSLAELAAQTSLILSNRHFVTHLPRPLQPSVIEVGGLHIRPSRPLPQAVGKVIEEAERVILFSMGSFLLGKSWPPMKRDAFLKAFSKLNETVLWKYEEEIPNKPNNVILFPWLPQRDVLGERKVSLFITHGGALSLSEGVYCGVPILGIPLFGDQGSNMKAIQERGTGIILPYQQLSEQTVLQAINTILHDNRYKEKAMELSKAYSDRSVGPLESGIFWTEYVARHKGAKHLFSNAANLSWWETSLLDVIGAALFSTIGLALAVHYTAVKLSTALAHSIATHRINMSKKNE